MLIETNSMLATFTSPESVGVSLASMLWLIPLAAAIAVVYKATKLETITTKIFIKEVAALLASIVVFMAIAALSLYILARVLT